MKKIPGWLVGMLVVLGVGVFVSLSQSGTSVVYENNDEPANEPVVETPAWMQDADAIAAAEAVVKRKELEAREAELVGQVKALQTELDSVRKELGTYWRDPENVKALIRSAFPEDSSTAIAIAKCESGLKPHAYNPKNTNGTTDGGLWQINSVHDKTLERMGLDKFDPEDATKFARYLYETNGGWGDWVCYHKIVAMR